MFDALIDRQYRNVTGIGETARSEQLLQADERPRRPVGTNEDPIDEIRPRQVDFVLRDGFALVGQEPFGIRAEYFLNSADHESSLSPVQQREYQ